MNNKINLVILICLLVLSSCSKHNTEKAPANNSMSINTKQLDKLGKAFLTEQQVLGFSVAIASGDDIIYQQNYGHVDAAQYHPVNEKTRFEVASVSKLIGVTVIMKLVELGHIDLQQSLATLLPDFPERGVAEKIKLKHLISNTSGLPDYADTIYEEYIQTGHTPEREDFLAYFAEVELIFKPGTNYQYSNSGFLLMAFIAEHVTGKSWQQLINQYINEPTGLDFQLLKHVVEDPEMSAIFDLKDESYTPVPTWDFLIGDGGITATAAMLAQFAGLWSSGNIIEPNLYAAMVKPKEIRSSIPTGYGFGVRNGRFFDEPMIGHTGGWKTTYAIMTYFPRLDVSFAAVMNTDGTPADISTLFVHYMSELLNQSKPNLTDQPSTKYNPANYIGHYTGFDVPYSDESRTVNINQSHLGNLEYCFLGQCENMKAIGVDRFWLKSFPFDFVEFIRNKENQVVAMREYHYGFFQVFRLRQKTTELIQVNTQEPSLCCG